MRTSKSKSVGTGATWRRECEALLGSFGGGEIKQKPFKLTVKSKESQSPDTIKDLLKSKINPTKIKVGINSLKSLRDGRVLIETGSKEEVETLTRDINEKCREKMVANTQ